MAVIVLLAIPFYAGIYHVFNRINKKILRKIMEDSADLESHMVESLNTVTAIKEFSATEYVNLKTETRFYRLLHSVYHASKSQYHHPGPVGIAGRIADHLGIMAGFCDCYQQ